MSTLTPALVMGVVMLRMSRSRPRHRVRDRAATDLGRAEIIIRPIQEALDGKVVVWMEKVSDEQY